jgi:hypothetical protein
MPAIVEFPQVVREALGEMDGVCCLSERADNKRMWSYYADGHRGFV